ncbi:hypothetical protein JAAARDRAFT_217584 [Jaapia argillacea MUCL 33604]|uniref:Uncharacterized protein n=1 Tax=Jaapia argillacea MUCL 33604 TaxID=933084 RepID=A0A067QD88_9AGAM|nr:hypothetical protein JAAARDRAFT_217584 [Jaapia argillacea MUCL 33604]
MSRFSKPSLSLVYVAAKAVVQILQSAGVTCAAIGGLAGKLYGNPREPNDVDMLLFLSVSSHDQEHWKNYLISKDANFFTKAAKTPGARYRVLWYRRNRASGYGFEECKVDLLLAGVMHLPLLQAHHIQRIDGIPVVPFSVLLLFKLQAWHDHRGSLERWKREKAYMDYTDIRALLSLREATALQILKPWDDTVMFSKAFIGLSKERVRSLCLSYPEMRDKWVRLGLYDSEVDTLASLFGRVRI